MKTTPLVILALLLTGCPSVTTPPPHVVVAPTGTATAAEIADLKARNEKLKQIAGDQQDLAQNASGAVFGAQDANKLNPTGLPKEAVIAQLAEASSALPPPTPEQKLAKERDNARIMAGELLTVKAEMGLKVTENEKLKAGNDGLLKRAIGAEADAAAAKLAQAGAEERAGAAAKLQKQFDELAARLTAKDKEITDLKGAWTRNTQLWAARALVAAGILIVIAGAAIVWISGLSAIGKAGGIALSGLMLIGSGLIVGHRYFLPVAGTALVVGLAAGAWYIWHVRRTQQVAKGLMAAVQDVKDAAAAGSEKAIVAAKELKESLLYRFPRTSTGNASPIEQEIDRRLVVDGVNAAPTAAAAAP